MPLAPAIPLPGNDATKTQLHKGTYKDVHCINLIKKRKTGDNNVY